MGSSFSAPQKNSFEVVPLKFGSPHVFYGLGAGGRGWLKPCASSARECFGLGKT